MVAQRRRPRSFQPTRTFAHFTIPLYFEQLSLCDQFEEMCSDGCLFFAAGRRKTRPIFYLDVVLFFGALREGDCVVVFLVITCGRKVFLIVFFAQFVLVVTGLSRH